jgi:hypothetical protein
LKNLLGVHDRTAGLMSQLSAMRRAS